MNSQRKAILKFLSDGHTLTALQALQKFGCLRLAGRINELRAGGLNIKTEIVATSTGKHVARYRLLPPEGHKPIRFDRKADKL